MEAAGSQMPILQRRDLEAVQKRFDIELKRDVKLTLFTSRNVGGLFIPGRECKSCGPTQELLEELSALSPKVRLEIVDYFSDPEDAQALGIDKIPAIVVAGDGAANVRLYGLPAGYEFAVLLEALVSASSKRSPLQLETRRRLKALKEDVHIQVFVTPT